MEITRKDYSDVRFGSVRWMYRYLLAAPFGILAAVLVVPVVVSVIALSIGIVLGVLLVVGIGAIGISIALGALVAVLVVGIELGPFELERDDE